MSSCIPILIIFFSFSTLHQLPIINITDTNHHQVSDSTGTNDIEIAGIIIDATQTKIGKDFYDLFYQQWNGLEDLPLQSVTVSEKALPQLGSQISVEVEDYLVFQQNIQPRYEIIEQMAGYALQQALLFVQNYDEMQKQLLEEDLKGTGIY
jgi:curli production assembly/transport component CsgE